MEIRQQEQQHLQETLAVVKGELSKTERALGMQNGEDRLLSVQDDGSSDSEIALQIMRMNLQTLHQLRLSAKSPYFARLDFTPAPGTPALGGLRPGEKTPVYIGRWGVLQTPEYRVCVHDWRSPVANLYYSGQTGRVSYEAPDGAVEGELTLKRMFTIADGKLLGLQDTGVVGQEVFLTEALSQATTSRLREVVTTIQAEQNAVIRSDPQAPLCVQGTAGSGKTTIALHRVAWLLYRLQRTVRPEQMLILAPNPLFLSYISRVLPDLGVEKVRQQTFPQLCAQLLGKRFPRLLPGTGVEERLRMTKAGRDALDAALACKGALSLYGELRRFLSEWEQSCIPHVNLKLGETVLVSADDLRHSILVELRHLPLQMRIAKTRRMVSSRLEQAIDQVRTRLEAAADDKLNRLLRALPDGPERRERATRLLAARDERMEELSQRQHRLLKEYDALWGSTDLLTVYAAFWQDMAGRGPAYTAAAERTLAGLRKKRVSPEDLPALLVLARGLYEMKRLDVRHVVIDEAQDVSPLQVKVLRELAGHDAFTLVGDLCQGLSGDAGLRDWDALREGVFTAPMTLARLSTAYRSTVEITETALAVMARHPVPGAGETRPVLRHGPAPAHIRVRTEDRRLPAIRAQVEAWREEGFENIAVIVKSAESARALAGRLPARWVARGDESFEGGLQVLDASLVKGLEFDCAVIADADNAAYPDEPFYAKLFYVLCTRPLHRLAFVSGPEPTKHLSFAG